MGNSKMKYLYILLISVIISCTSRTSEPANQALAADSVAEEKSAIANGFDQNNYATFLDLNNYLTDSAPQPETLIIIDSTCTIIIDPTADQITKMEAELGDDMATVADDNSYYQYEATKKLDSLNVKMVFAEKRFIKLQGVSQTWTLDIRKEGAPAWNIILFHTGKKPEVISPIDVSNEKINEYFRN
jgi:hypothetical protein